jgi:DsbC/DsbD-like thiol-disulfide interchange protein
MFKAVDFIMCLILRDQGTSRRVQQLARSLPNMRPFRLIFAPPVLLLAAGLPAIAASNSADVAHLHVQLVVPSSTLSPGNSAEAGLYFKLEPGWHVYWKNAGDSGEPPRMKWTLPDGITAGPLQFPAPKRLPLGPLMDFGYEDEVLFPFAVKVGTNAKSGSATLHAKVDWLVCREVCIPGKAELEVTRPVTDQASTTAAVEPDASLYARLRNRLPGSAPATFKAGFQPTPTAFRLTVLTGQKETQASFFPADQNIIDNPAPQRFTATAKGLTLDLKKDANLTAAPAELRGVLELSNGRAYEVVAPGGPPVAGVAAPLKRLRPRRRRQRRQIRNPRPAVPRHRWFPASPGLRVWPSWGD